MTARRALLANASFTAASAIVLIAARDALYPLFALSSPSLLTSIGVVLLLYAGTLVVEARRKPPQKYALVTAALLDAGWVVGSIVVLVLAWSALAPAGRVLIIAAALIVEVFAFLQFSRIADIGGGSGGGGRAMRTLIVVSLATTLGGVPAGPRPVMGDPPGRLIDVQGHKLHIHCTGTGSPTVVIDGGAGAWSVFYAHIQKALSGARVCTISGTRLERAALRSPHQRTDGRGTAPAGAAVRPGAGPLGPGRQALERAHGLDARARVRWSRGMGRLRSVGIHHVCLDADRHAPIRLDLLLIVPLLYLCAATVMLLCLRPMGPADAGQAPARGWNEN